MPQTKYFTKEITLSHSKVKFPAKLAYRTLGKPDNPAILLPTCYGGTLSTTSPFLYSSESALFSPYKYFIIIVGLLSGSESSSPSNTPAPYNGPNFPKTTYEDNIRLQYALCTEELGIETVFAYIGFSMGAQQAYHMSVLYPDFVENMVAIAGSAKTSWHNWCFLEGPRHALINSSDFLEGMYTSPPRKGLQAFERVYSTWALSPEWFRRECWRDVGCGTLQEYLERNWEGGNEDANDLLSLLWTWQDGDVTRYFGEDGGKLERTLGRVKARCLIMPVSTDQYFLPEESEVEVKCLKKGELRVIPSVWGHLAGGGNGTKDDTEFMIREIGRFLKLR